LAGNQTDIQRSKSISATIHDHRTLEAGR